MKRPYLNEREARVHWWVMGCVLCLAFWSLNTEEVAPNVRYGLGAFLLFAFFVGDDLTHILIIAITVGLLYLRAV